MTLGDTFPAGTPLQDGRFVITGVIANGGQATTYEAIDKSNGTRVAIKRFSVRGASSWKEVELAERETRVLSGLAHPGLPKVVSHFEEAGALYLVLEFIEGSTLEQSRAEHRLSQRDVIDYLRQVGDILEYLHSQSPPIVHRDIKPRNLIRRPDGSIVLVDFGSVRDRLKTEGGSTVVGTFGYMAPEQFQGRAMPASDTYGAAATALAILTGRDPDQLPHQGLKLDVAKALDGSTSPALQALLSATLDPNPDARPASLKAALARYLPAGHPSNAGTARERVTGSSTSQERGRRRHARHPTEEHTRDVGEAPFHTPGYQRDRSARRSRAERRRDARRAQHRPSAEEVDVITPFSEALAVPGVRRVLRVPLLGLIAVMFLVLLRIVLWLLLGVALPRFLQLIQRVTGAQLDDAIHDTSSVGTALHDQFREVTNRVRGVKYSDGEHSDGENSDTSRRYRVAAPNERSTFDTIADEVDARAQEIEDELEKTFGEWNASKPRK